jgi:hypothetical protein
MKTSDERRKITRSFMCVTPMSEIEIKAKAVVSVWNRQSSRVFESMGSDNPRAKAIDDAIQELERALAQTIEIESED